MAMARAAIAVNGLTHEETAEDLEERLMVSPLQRLGYSLYEKMAMLFSSGDSSYEKL